MSGTSTLSTHAWCPQEEGCWHGDRRAEAARENGPLGGQAELQGGEINDGRGCRGSRSTKKKSPM